MTPSKIAVVVAHPDDAELWAGGTILNHLDAGDTIQLWYLCCTGDLRREEARRAAALLASEARFPIGSARLLQDLVDFRPDALITHWERDSHVDHHRTFAVIWKLLPRLTIEFNVWPRVYSCDTYNSLGREPTATFEPTDIIDISDVWDRKLQLLAVYQSQPIDHFSAMAERQGKLHGARTGVRFAEAFRQIPVLGSLPRHRQLLVSK
jgi:LmbE family N-acetylglucosaminyl deacetylase